MCLQEIGVYTRVMIRTPALLLLAAVSPAFAAYDPFFDQGREKASAPVAVRARELVGSSQKVAQADFTAEPPRLTRPSDIDGRPPASPKQESGGFMSGFKKILRWDERSLPAFAIGMGIGFGIVFFSGMFFANPLLAVAGGLFAGLVIGFLLNAFK